MIKSERQNLVRRQPCPILVHNPETVRITIQSQTELRLATADECTYLAHPFGIGFGMMPPEKGIQFIMKNRQLRPSLFQQRVQVPATGAVHELHGNLELRLSNRMEVDQLPELPE